MSIEYQTKKRQHDNDLMETNEDQNSNLGNKSNDHEEKEPKFVYTPEEKKLLRKINITTVPFICAITFLQVSMTEKTGPFYCIYKTHHSPQKNSQK